MGSSANGKVLLTHGMVTEIHNDIELYYTCIAIMAN